jgi:hypothetical protein
MWGGGLLAGGPSALKSSSSPGLARLEWHGSGQSGGGLFGGELSAGGLSSSTRAALASTLGSFALKSSSSPGLAWLLMHIGGL